MIPEGVIISGFISKFINDGIDILKSTIQETIENQDENKEDFQFYQVIINVLNQLTFHKYKENQNVIYDAAESLLREMRESKKISIEAVRKAFHFFEASVDQEGYKKFKKLLCHEICKKDELFREVSLRYQGQLAEGVVCTNNGINEVKEIIADITEKSSYEKNLLNLNTQKILKSRTKEYADKWDKNMFLNDFDKRDENAGVNVALKEVYPNEQLPHYKFKKNENISEDLKELLTECMERNRESEMLLILGQPGIGKSTLITWIAIHFRDRLDDVLVYKFAADLNDVDWKSDKIVDRMLHKLGLSYEDLNGRALILDGFDEISAGDNREGILVDFYYDFISSKKVNNFVLIVTCRENYIHGYYWLQCSYIILQPWDECQIQRFCRLYAEKTCSKISEDTIKNALQNKEILGIPLLLYMVLALNIVMTKEGSIVDVYDKIFSLEGGIYDRCIANKYFSERHRIGSIKKPIHQISREISIWMFENKAENASIPQEEYEKICINVMRQSGMENEELKEDFLIGNFYKLARHCDGIETKHLYFVHRSIYEYFVAETIYSSVEEAIKKLTDESQEELAGNIAVLLKQGCITHTIGEYLKYRILRLYSVLEQKKQERFYRWWEEAVEKMIDAGMFYYTKRNIREYKNILIKERNCFFNMIEILRLLFSVSDSKYIRLNNITKISNYIALSELPVNLNHLYLEEIDLTREKLMRANLRNSYLGNQILNKVNLTGADLMGADLHEANLMEADLTEAKLKGANLSRAMLSRAKLKGADLRGAKLRGAYLIEAYMGKAKLFGADLKEARLNRAKINEADLRRADLIKADLSNAKLNSTDLSKAKLRNADLGRADLSNAKLVGADLRGANLNGTDLSFADISEANVTMKELEKAILKDTILSAAATDSVKKS